MNLSKYIMSLGLIGVLSACATTDPNEAYPKVMAIAETERVASTGDAADDPAIWINDSNVADSRILGTDKQAGLYVYDLNGTKLDFLPSGELNNVDLRQSVSFSGLASVDIAAATNRTINGVTLFEIDQNGQVQPVGDFNVDRFEPYGLCVGYDEAGYRVFVTFKTGEVDIYQLAVGKDGYEASLSNTIKLNSQLEGCVYDETQNVLFVGEEAVGLWRIDLRGNDVLAKTLVDTVGSDTGLVADVEGVALWRDVAGQGYVIASAQEADRYVIYERSAPNRWVGTFSISDNEILQIDGVSHTDGLAVNSTNFGTTAPSGMLVVQDDADGEDGSPQNFKFVSWQDIERALSSN